MLFKKKRFDFGRRVTGVNGNYGQPFAFQSVRDLLKARQLLAACRSSIEEERQHNRLTVLESIR